MDLVLLRKKHPRFIYESYSIKKEEKKLIITFNFKLEPDIVFKPKLSIPIESTVEDKKIENLVFHLGLIELISYWKATCSPEIIIKAANLSSSQLAWLRSLIIQGLGEFFYKNNIDFTSGEFFSITSDSDRLLNSYPSSQSTSGDLILVGEGKDSAVTLESLKDLKTKKMTLVLNPAKAALKNIATAGYKNIITVQRTIDEKLLRLNNHGYLNGHTPFSAYLAFLGILIGTLYSYQNVIASNEKSANEGNVKFHHLEVNHQYSKSYPFEKLFRDYCFNNLTHEVNYFSFLRPLYNLQISKLFASYKQYHSTFRSCNINRNQDSWCGKCAKCVFTFLSLFPFLDYSKLIDIFGKDYFLETEMMQFFRGFVGLEKNKPFECVGTTEESILAVALCLKKYKSENKPIPSLLQSLEKDLNLNETFTKKLEQKIIKNWDGKHFLPEEYAELLKNLAQNL